MPWFRVLALRATETLKAQRACRLALMRPRLADGRSPCRGGVRSRTLVGPDGVGTTGSSLGSAARRPRAALAAVEAAARRSCELRQRLSGVVDPLTRTLMSYEDDDDLNARIDRWGL